MDTSMDTLNVAPTTKEVAPIRPSDYWTENQLDTPDAIRILAFVESLNFKSLVSHATQLRRGRNCFVRKDKFARGKDNIIFEIEFSDSIV